MKKLLLSVYAEKIAIDISLNNNYTKPLPKNVVNEILYLLKSEKKMQSIDEFRKILSILSFGKIINNSTPEYIINEAYQILINSFGKNNKDYLDIIFKGKLYNNYYRSFIIVLLENNTVCATSIIIEHELKKKNKKNVITWEVQFFSSLKYKKGYGSKLWNLITNLASKRNIDAILVPSTKKALSFWLKQNSIICPIYNTILINNDSLNINKLDKYKIKKQPCDKLYNLYSLNKFNTSEFKSPYKWCIQDTIHVWFFPKKNTIHNSYFLNTN